MAARWLLNNFTTVELGLIIVGGAVLLGFTGLLLTRRLLPAMRASESNDITGVILGVLAAVYGIVLAFVIVALYEEYRQAGADVRTEATALSEVYRDSRAFTPAAAANVGTAVGDYIYFVVAKEWSAMKDGRESEQAWHALDRIYGAVESYSPKTLVQQAFYEETVARVNNLAGARRERLNDAEESLPATFDILLIAGAILLLAATSLFGTQNPRLHMLLTTMVALLIGFNLLLALVLDYPFSGQVSVSTNAFTQGALSDFNYRLAGVPRP